jgi:hypothetical protein
MNKIAILVLFFSSAIHAQRYAVNIQSYGRDPYQVYIDGELQSHLQGLNFRIQGVVNGVREMKILVFTVPLQTYTTTIGTTGQPEEFYTFTPSGKYYKLALSKDAFRFGSGNLPVRANYIPKRKLVKRDSTYQQPHTCEMTDSAVNVLISNIASLPTEAAKQNLQTNTLRAKCLLTYQIRAITARHDNDSIKMREYKKLYKTCNDKSHYYELYKSFRSEDASQEFNSWLGSQQ